MEEFMATTKYILFNVRLKAEQIEYLKNKAEQQDVSLSKLMRDFINKKMTNDLKKASK